MRCEKQNVVSLFVALLMLGFPALGFGQGLPSVDDLANEEFDDPAPVAEEPVAEIEAPAAEVEEPSTQDEPETSAEVEGEPGEDEEHPGYVPRGQFVSPSMDLEGGLGFHGITAARGGAPMSFRVAFLGEIYSGAQAVRHNDHNDTLAGNLLIQGTFLEHFSANFRIQAKNSVNTFGRPQAMLSQGDMLLGLRGHYPVVPGLDLGGDLTFYVPSSFGGVGLSGSGISVRPRLLASLDFGELIEPINGHRVALDGHFNIGYRIDNTENLVPDGMQLTRVERFAYGISAYDMLEIGLGFQYDLPYVSPFLGWTLGIPVNVADGLCDDMDIPLKCVSGVGFKAYPQVMSLGVKGEPIEHLGLHAGIDFGLTSSDALGLPVTLPFNFIIGMSWTIDHTPEIQIEERIVETEKIVEKLPPMGYLVGAVTDEQTGAPISNALVHYSERPESAQATAPTTGVFRSYGFAIGDEIAMEFTHPEYEPTSLVYLIEEEGEFELQVSMVALPRSGWIRGVITDIKGEPVPSASVKLTGPENHELTTNEAGAFQKELKSGSYTIAASAKDFRTSGKDATLAANGELQVDIVLHPRPGESLVELGETEIRIQDRVYFETGKATILNRSFGMLDQIASLMFENPQVKKIEIQGHTDDVGAADFNLQLSQERSEAVRDYLIEIGVGPERLTAKGLGSAMPLVPNTSNRNRGLNRRVEFKILE